MSGNDITAEQIEQLKEAFGSNPNIEKIEVGDDKCEVGTLTRSNFIKEKSEENEGGGQYLDDTEKSFVSQTSPPPKREQPNKQGGEITAQDFFRFATLAEYADESFFESRLPGEEVQTTEEL